MKTAHPSRILVVGCSRSGTTLLQSLLASHSRVHTFPETGVFLRAFGMRGKVLPWVPLGLTIGKERKALARLLEAAKKVEGGLPALPPRRISLSRSLLDAATFLDAMARANGKDVWVEKTPRHVFHARKIRRMIPGVLCIHMVRRGEDVVASIVDRARKYPDRFPNQIDPSYGIRQWNRSVRATRQAVDEPGHVLVFYESLVQALEPSIRCLCRICGLGFEPAMLTPADRTSFSSPDEEWKSQVNAPVRPAVSKFENTFEKETRNTITRRLDTVTFQVLKGKALSASDGVFFSGFDRVAGA